MCSVLVTPLILLSHRKLVEEEALSGRALVMQEEALVEEEAQNERALVTQEEALVEEEAQNERALVTQDEALVEEEALNERALVTQEASENLKLQSCPEGLTIGMEAYLDTKPQGWIFLQNCIKTSDVRHATCTLTDETAAWIV